MSLNHSPSVVTNGLVLYTDMSNTQKSWKGAPATNLLTYSQDFSNSVWTTSAPPSTITPNYSVAPDGTNTATRLLYQDGVNCRVFQTITCVVGQTYTFSVWIKSNTGSSQVVQLYLRQTGFGTTYANVNPTATNEWQRFSISLTVPVGVTDIMTLVYKSGASGSWDILMWGAQYELSSYATPYIPTTSAAASRSTSQALVDLTGNTTLTANSLTYASDGTFSFNGTSDYITAPSTALAVTSWTQPWTLGVWMYVPASATWSDGTNQSHFVSKGNTVGSWGLIRGANNNSIHAAIRTDAGVYQTGGSITRDAWYNVVGTWDGISTVNTYINGALADFATATTLSGVPDTQNLTIGRALNTFAGSPGTYYTGKLPSVVGYNRALSATEVAQNFNALRGRYGI